MANSINQFFKENRKNRENIFVPVSKRFVDDKGEALKWELRPIPSNRLDKIRARAIGKDGNLDSTQFGLMLTAASVVDPNLNDTKLQDSYGVKKAEDLLYELMYWDELLALEAAVIKLNGLDESLPDLVEQVKN